jgi:PPM family protein phosphatase
MGYIYKSISKKGSSKKFNEDSIGIVEMDDGVLCIVCDGIGGSLAAETASECCVNSIKNFFLESDERNHLSKIRKSINFANSELFELAHSKKEFKGMATTTDVFFFNNHTVFWGHIGDSRIYHLKNGKLYLLTKDHSLVQQMLDRGYISMKAASRHPNKNVIMNAMGEGKSIEIDSSKLILNIKDNHRFMICSDGVTAVINDVELEKILNMNDVDDCINELDRNIQNGGAPDDYSIIIIERTN